jgi:uncharacterized protein YnzC (UPF0291/DUF896 family)
MIVFLDGLSGIGKTYLTDKLIERNPDWIRFKGAGQIVVGMQQRWQDYNFFMHNVIERLDQINNYKKVILWDRGLTDATYNEDEQYRKEILRVAKSHIKKCAVFIKIDKKEWALLAELRGSKEGGDWQKHLEKYEEVMSSFNTHHMCVTAPNFYIEDYHIEAFEKFLKGLMK